MNKAILSLIFLVMFISGCSSKNPDINNNNTQSKGNQKVFEQEDTLIMFALRAEQLRDNKTASTIFYKIYKKSNKKEYLYRSLNNLLLINENKTVIQLIDKHLKETKEDEILIRLKVIALIQSGELKEAEKLAIYLVEKTKRDDDYILVSNIYVREEKFDLAIKYLESAYYIDYNENILDKMSIILYVNLDRKKDAIAQLETHSRVHGCSITVCKRLVAFYSNDNNLDGLLSVYLRIYKIDPSQINSKKIVQLYAYKKEYAKLILFLEDTKSDNKTLLQLYISAKDYKKASMLAQKLYDETGEIRYLGESAIYTYEGAENKDDKKLLKIVSTKFNKVINENRDSLYLNYYGYLLIDHKIDVNKGIKYVKEALINQPNSAFYLDSLAWGYYRQGKCKDALSIIKKVLLLEDGDDPEVIKHHQIIKKCKLNKGKK
jgi:predicted Zn-dependent protease